MCRTGWHPILISNFELLAIVDFFFALISTFKQLIFTLIIVFLIPSNILYPRTCFVLFTLELGLHDCNQSEIFPHLLNPVNLIIAFYCRCELTEFLMYLNSEAANMGLWDHVQPVDRYYCHQHCLFLKIELPPILK